MAGCVSHRWVVAIDIGTAESGYAFFMTNGTEQDVWVNKWGDKHMVDRHKTPTYILFDENQKFLEFGSSAESTLKDMDPENRKNVHFFKHFKMALYREWKAMVIPEDAQLTARNGRVMPAVKVFAGCLGFMRDEFARYLKKIGHTLKYEDVLWVMTLPALWRCDAKNVMREAAYEAELVRREDPNRLLVALESEAAGLYCDTLLVVKEPKQQFQPQDDMTLEAISKGDQYMIVDCGGGTVDIAVHERLDAGENGGFVKEIAESGGGKVGGHDVNSAFEHFLEELLSKDIMRALEKEKPVVCLQQCEQFEGAKRCLKPKARGSYDLNVPVLAGLNDFLEDKRDDRQDVKGSVRAFLKHYSGSYKVRYREGNFGFQLTLPEEGTCSGDGDNGDKLLLPTLRKVEQVVVDKLKEINMIKDKDIKLTRVFLVGGFSKCPMVFDLLKRAVKDLQPQAEVLQPKDCDLAVLKGAVLFGRNPNAVSERVITRTFGVKSQPEFDKDKHAIRKQLQRSLKDSVCVDVFDIFVRAGEVKPSGYTVTRSYAPHDLDQEIETISCYGCLKHDPEPKYVDDVDKDGVKIVNPFGTLEITYPTEEDSVTSDSQLTPLEKLERKMVDVTFHFGTEILVTAELHQPREDGATGGAGTDGASSRTSGSGPRAELKFTEGFEKLSQV